MKHPLKPKMLQTIRNYLDQNADSLEVGQPCSSDRNFWSPFSREVCVEGSFYLSGTVILK